MCGITGIFNFNKDKHVDLNQLKSITDVLAHRGPDGEGFFSEDNIGLGHRRLSIIDVEQGIQPMYSNDENIVLVFNGEIYNYIELRNELKTLGYTFHTQSDTEVIIQAYKHWGIDFQNKLNGMWAMAIWDKKKQQLLLSRDRIGEKPLFFYKDNNTLVFASEIKSIKQFGVELIPRTELIQLYLFFCNIPDSNTFYKNIYQLKPGHCLIISTEKVQERKYWDLPNIDESNLNKNANEVYEKFQFLLQDSIRLRMRSDVPFGAFLSGGLDSSSVVALMSQFTQKPIQTFTIGFPNNPYDESKLAELVAKKFNTKHTLQTVQPETFEKMVQLCTHHFDEPFGDSSAIPTYFVSKFAAENVKMVLTGDGGDEVLSGYNSYLGLKLTQKFNSFPHFVRKSVPKIAQIALPFAKGNIRFKLNKVQHFSQSASLPFKERFMEKKPYAELSFIKTLTQNIDCIQIEDFLQDVLAKIPTQDDFYRLMYLNFKYDLPDDYLVKVDRMSMANSLETRTPFLDYRLIEFMISVDKNIKLQGLQRKSVLRNSVGKLLPKELLSAPKKGFGIPLYKWFTEDNTLSKITLNESKKILDNKHINHIIENNKKGKADYGNFIWTLLMLEQNL